MDQSRAESPPPKIEIVLFSKIFLFLIEYNILSPSNFSHPFTENFLGSKDPTPPAITILATSNSLRLLVFTCHRFLIFLSSSTLWFKWKLILKG